MKIRWNDRSWKISFGFSFTHVDWHFGHTIEANKRIYDCFLLSHCLNWLIHLIATNPHTYIYLCLTTCVQCVCSYVSTCMASNESVVHENFTFSRILVGCQHLSYIWLSGWALRDTIALKQKVCSLIHFLTFTAFIFHDFFSFCFCANFTHFSRKFVLRIILYQLACVQTAHGIWRFYCRCHCVTAVRLICRILVFGSLMT